LGEFCTFSYGLAQRAPRLLAQPQEEQGCAFENESIGELGLRQSIQQPLAAETTERELVLDTELAASFDQSCLHRRDDVLGAAALHRTTVSR
jgi:hypothetical protein